jgi:RNA polymerase sigma-70 factor, ECF subfamily
VLTDPAADRASLIELRQGDALALNRLISRWQRPLVSFAYRYVQNAADANDLAAEAFVKLYQNRERLRSDTILSAWLFTTLTNLCHNHHRWRKRHPSVALDPESRSPRGSETRTEPELVSAEPAPGAALARDESLEAVRRAIEELPHDLKVTVLLHHYEHLSYREIASITHCSERGVETRLYRARKQLRQSLAGFLREASPA